MASSLEALLKEKKGAPPAEPKLDNELASEPEIGDAETEPDINDTDSVAAPKTKTELAKMTAAQLDELHESLVPSMNGPVDGFGAMSVKDKKAALATVLFGPPAEAASAPEAAMTAQEDETPAPAAKSSVKIVTKDTTDVLVKLAKEIEGLSDQDEIEQRIRDTMAQEGLSDFTLGGLFVRLQELGNFGEYKTFSAYVDATYDTKYRKARYLMDIYQTLVGLGIPWDDVKAVGWTKLKELTGVLTAENYMDWIAKAKSMNTDSLIAEVKASKSGGDTDEGDDSAAPVVKSVVSKTFKLHEDQLETVNAALAQAKDVAKTEVDTVALDLICQEYLGNAPTVAPQAAAAPAAPVLDPKAFFEAVRAEYQDPKDAAVFMFGEYFDVVFPEIELEVSFK